MRDCDATKPAAECKEIGIVTRQYSFNKQKLHIAFAFNLEYPKADGVLSFDLLTNLQRSGTSHEGQRFIIQVHDFFNFFFFLL